MQTILVITIGALILISIYQALKIRKLENKIIAAFKIAYRKPLSSSEKQYLTKSKKGGKQN